MSLPAVPPGLLGSVIDALPTRLAKRLDQTVSDARSWPVHRTDDGVAISVDDQTVVTLAATIAGLFDVACTCLLAPRCLHVAATLSIAPIAGPAEDGPSEESGPTPTPTAPVHEAREVTAAEIAAAQAVWNAVTAILSSGAAGAGSAAQAALLRAAHEARALRLYRAATAATRIVEQLRDYHCDDPAFRLADLVADIREALTVADGLRRGKPLHGVGHRAYRHAGNGHLRGLFCEPIITTSGYAGAVTHLVDTGGRMWQVASVLPGDGESVAARADSPIAVADARHTPRQLGRSGLLTMDLQATPDGRVSTGRSVRAVSGPGATWYEPPLATLWEQPLDAQIERYRKALAMPVLERPCGHDLLFFDATICGTASDALIVRCGTGSLSVRASHDSPHLKYVDNLRTLAATSGATARRIARAKPDGSLAVLALGAEWLPERFDGHVDLGLDTLTRADLPQPGAAVPMTPAFGQTPPLHLLARRVERAVESGRPATVGDARDADRLRAVAMPTAAQLTEALDEACRLQRDVFGRAKPGAADAFGEAWLEAAVYVNAATISAVFS
jgi:hypothetical protein